LLKRTTTVCQVLHSLGVGGAEVLAARLARQLAGEFRFLFVCLDDLGTLGQELRDQGFPVTVLERRSGLDWRCSWRLAKLVRQERVDVIHAHQYSPFFYALLARLLCQRPSILFMEHGRSFPDYPRPKRKVVNRLLLQRRDRVVAVGVAVQQALIHNEGIPPKKVEVVYNGINLAAYANGSHDRRAVRQEIGVGDQDLVIIQVARLDPLKDHATAIHTLEHVVRRRADARLVLVGEGPELGMIKRVVAECNLSSQVRLLGLRKDIGRLLSAADVFLLTSVSEGIPLAVIEAMAAGLPVVATRVGGTGEVVEEGQTGLLAPAGDSAALAMNILRLADDSTLGHELGQRGRERAQAVFSESQMLASYAQRYREMRSISAG
jgi:glycosyltransferase involved in cell wall biosynthesis